jgi:hypothetical protein
MITGKGSGSGIYSFHQAINYNKTVQVSHMPDDGFDVRISFQHDGETSIPILKINEKYAELLWSCLKRMADDLKWSDDLEVK